jgi:copper ion binding protein
MTRHATVLSIPGMSCASCVRHVTTALGAVPGVSKVDVQLKSGMVFVQHDAEAPVGHLTQALLDAGYESSVREEVSVVAEGRRE